MWEEKRSVKNGNISNIGPKMSLVVVRQADKSWDSFGSDQSGKDLNHNFRLTPITVSSLTVGTQLCQLSSFIPVKSNHLLP
jgi:hypothetical protein